MPRFRSRRTVVLLGYLAAERRAVARERLATLFWPDDEPSKGRANLSRELHNLAQILPGCWEQDRQTAAFAPSPDTAVDLDRVRQLEKQGRWEEAADLLGGEFLEGLSLDQNLELENWLLGERDRWRVRAVNILEHVIAGHGRRGRYSDALRYAQRLLQLEPWNEATHRHMMQLLAWTGKRGAALRQFESCRTALWEELGVRPSDETEQLREQIRDGVIDLPPQLPAFLTDEKPRHAFERPPFVGRERELARMDAFLKEAAAGESRVLFVTGGPGRGKTALLNAFSQQAMAIHPEILVAGAKCDALAGLGDPYLPYREILATLTGDVEGRWDAGAITRDHAIRLWQAYPSVVETILDLGPQLMDTFVPAEVLLSRSTAAGHVHAHWLPRLREAAKHHAATAEAVEQNRLFQQLTAVLQAIARERPLLLILDDVQWADAASVALLFHLGRSLAGSHSKLLIACAYRPEEVITGQDGRRHPLAKVASEFKRTFGNVWVDLGLSKSEERRRFVDALVDVEPNDLGNAFRTALFGRTGGHPLFTVELLRSLKQRGDLRKDTAGRWVAGPELDWQVLPARVEAVIAERIDRLEPELRQILSIASVEGEQFTAQVIAEVEQLSLRAVVGDLSQRLEQRHGLVREQEEVYAGRKRLTRYRFGHVLFRDYLYGRLAEAERRLLHQDVASALAGLYEGQLEEMAVQMAHHFFHAGMDDEAFQYFALAGERASRLFASQEALSHYTRAIELSDRVQADSRTLARLYRGRGVANETVGEFALARRDHEVVLQLAGAAEEKEIEWRALLDLGKLWRSRDYERSRVYFESALALAREGGDKATLATSLNWMGNWHANDGNPLQAVVHHQEALKIAEQWMDGRELANTLDLLGIAHLLAGDLNASRHYYDRAIQLFRELENRLRLTNSLIGRATTTSSLIWLATVPASSTVDAELDLQEALHLANEIRSAPDVAWAHWSSGMLHVVRGQFGSALEHSGSALRIATEIGHREFVAASHLVLGSAYAVLFEGGKALEHLQASLALSTELHSSTMIRLAAAGLAGLFLMMEDQDQARDCLEQAVAPETPMDTQGKRLCWLRLAELALVQDDPAGALDIVERLIAADPNMTPGRAITYLWKVKAEALATIGQTDAARSLLEEAIPNAQANRERFLLWGLHASLGGVYLELGRPEAAELEFDRARAVIEDLASNIPDEDLARSFRSGACAFLGSSDGSKEPQEVTDR